MKWDEEEELYQKRLRERRLEHWQLNSSDSELDISSPSHTHTKGLKSFSYLVPLKSSPEDHSRWGDTDSVCSETIYEESGWESGFDSEFEWSRAVTPEAYTEDKDDDLDTISIHSGPVLEDPPTALLQGPVPDTTELGHDVNLEHTVTQAQRPTSEIDPCTPELKSWLESDFVSKSGPREPSECDPTEVQESILGLTDIGTPSAPRCDLDLGKPKSRDGTVTGGETSSLVLKRTFELKIRKLPLVATSKVLTPTPLQSAASPSMVSTPTHLCHIQSAASHTSTQSMLLTPTQLQSTVCCTYNNDWSLPHCCSYHTRTIPMQTQPMTMHHGHRFHTQETSSTFSIQTPAIPTAAICNCCCRVISHFGYNYIQPLCTQMHQCYVSRPVYPTPQCVCHTCTNRPATSFTFLCTSHVQGESSASAVDPGLMQDDQLQRKRQIEDEESSCVCGPQQKKRCSFVHTEHIHEN